ncbi:MAG: hypothetical protein ACEPOZ_06660 [Marinifilaceae bacterium]|jgi:hypothetical protein
MFCCVFFFQIAGINGLRAQDVDNILNSKKVSVSGSFSANNVNYSAMGISRRKDAHTYYLSGNLNIALFEEWSIPLSFTYSNQEVDLSHGVSFNQIGLTPTYKWVKLYAGYSSMTFSPYSLSGHSFLGGGAELTPPGKFNASFMVGRLRKAEEPLSDEKEAMFSYKRMGYGMKLGYRDQGDEVNLIVFGAKDDKNSVKKIPENTEVTPMENLVLGLGIRKSLFDKVFIGADVTSSLLTRDTRLEERDGGNFGIFNLANGVMNANASSSVFTAFKTDVAYRDNDFSLGMQYERVDPDYQTLGAYYFTNDMENISLTASKQFFKGHLSVSANGGLQRNDLKKEKKSSMNNMVGSLNLGLQAGAGTNISLSYSNYTSFSNIRSDFEDINAVNQQQVYDTLDFTQISQNVSLSVSHALGDLKNANTRQNINANFNVQIASEKQEGKKKSAGTRFYNSGITYSISWKASRLSLSSSLNTNYNEMETGDALTLGPTLSVSKVFKKNLRSSLSGSWNRSYQNSKILNRIYVIRYNCSYALKKHNFTIGMNYMNRNEEKKFAEFTASLGYNYSF